VPDFSIAPVGFQNRSSFATARDVRQSALLRECHIYLKNDGGAEWNAIRARGGRARGLSARFDPLKKNLCRAMTCRNSAAGARESRPRPAAIGVDPAARP